MRVYTLKLSWNMLPDAILAPIFAVLEYSWEPAWACNGAVAAHVALVFDPMVSA